MENNPEVPGIGELSEQAFGLRVRELRLALGMTQAELAERMSSLGYGMSQTMVAKMERGARPTSVGELAVLGSIFSVGPADLLSGETLPPEVARLSGRRHRLFGRASAVAELSRRLEVGREGLRGEIRVFEDELEEIIKARGAGWLTVWGIDPGNPFGTDEELTKVIEDVKHSEA